MNDLQNNLFNTALSGHCCMLLGKAGTGKTYVLKKVVDVLSKRKNMQVTSSSDISSLLFETAKTLHSFARI